MAIERVLLAVSSEEEERIEKIGGFTADVAAPTGAEVTLAHVFASDGYDDLKQRLEFAPDDDVSPDTVAKRSVAVRDLTALLDEADVDYTVRGRTADSGAVGGEIVDLAEEADADLVVVGGRKRSPTGKAVFGSTAQEVMLEAPCPVTFVRNE
ncbi:MAG: universal stress protein [Haloarculaceae archaeon]